MNASEEGILKRNTKNWRGLRYLSDSRRKREDGVDCLDRREEERNCNRITTYWEYKKKNEKRDKITELFDEVYQDWKQMFYNNDDDDEKKCNSNKTVLTNKQINIILFVLFNHCNLMVV